MRKTTEEKTVEVLGKEYPYIRAFYQMLGSRPYFIAERLEEAKLAQAPNDAVSRKPDGRWQTIDQLTEASQEQLTALAGSFS